VSSGLAILWMVCLPAALRAAQTGSYLNYSEANFEVFCPIGATRCTDGVKFSVEHGTLGPKVPSSTPNFTPSLQQ